MTVQFSDSNADAEGYGKDSPYTEKYEGDFPGAERDRVNSPYGYRGDPMPDMDMSRRGWGRQFRRPGCFGLLSALVVLLLLAFLVVRFVFHLPFPPTSHASPTAAASPTPNRGLTVIQVGQVPTLIIRNGLNNVSLIRIHGGLSDSQVTVQTDTSSVGSVNYQESSDKRIVLFDIDSQTSGTLDVTVPELSNLKIDTNTTPILVESVQGQMVLTTNRGDVTIQKSALSGPSLVESNGGTLKMTDIKLNGSAIVDNNAGDITFQGIVKGTGKDIDQFNDENGGTLHVTLLQGSAVHIDATTINANAITETGEITSNIPGANVKQTYSGYELHIDTGTPPLTTLLLDNNDGNIVVNEQKGV